MVERCEHRQDADESSRPPCRRIVVFRPTGGVRYRPVEETPPR